MTNEGNKIFQSQETFADKLRHAFQVFKRRIDKLDWTLLILVLVLSIIGLIMVFSATMEIDPFGHTRTQLGAVVLGLIVIAILMVLPYHLFTNHSLMLLANAFVIALLVLTMIMGDEVNGAKSWLDFGFLPSFQPSEFFKISIIPLISLMIEYLNREEILSKKTTFNGFNAMVVAVFILGIVFIGAQPDFGMTIILVGTVMLMFTLLMGTLKFTLILFGSLLFIYLFLYGLSLKFGDAMVANGWHPLVRLAIFTNPFQFDLGEGYQLIEGFRAIQRGGLTGVGLGEGIGKSGRLPAVETDFIIAHIGEETGYIGILIVLILFFSLFLILFQRAAKTRDIYRRSVIVGVASVLVIQVLVNIAGTVSLIPLSGVTLPFISYGGTSLVVSYALIGLALRMILEERMNPQLNLVYARKVNE